MTTGHGDASERLIEQRVRNRIIEYLELAASFEEQQQYERDVSIAHVPDEVINQWGDQVWRHPSENPHNGDICNAAEVDALSSYNGVLEATSSAMPDEYPALNEVQTMPEWTTLRESAEQAPRMLMRRGQFPEDHEID